MPVLDLDDIQGFVLFSYAALPYACYLHAFFADGAATPNAWLGELSPEVTAAHARSVESDAKVNVALTSAGLARLGLDARELETFPRELQQGMGHPLRAHVLGDVGENAPEHWEVGGPSTKPVHALVLLFARDDDGLAALRAREIARIGAHGGEVVHEDDARITTHEHFGFADGIDQPHVAGSPRPRPAHHVEVPAGEFILGYENAYRELPPSPRGADAFDLGKNGTYLVYRKLAQDVSAFWSSMFAEAAKTTCDAGPDAEKREAVRLAARIVGRWPGGAPLVHHPDGDVGAGAYRKDFLFHESDPHGIACPLGAHVRRANPRDMLEPDPAASLKAVERHRLLRRGRSYGPPAPGGLRDRAKPDGHARGLLFLALNASIRRQFEFVQQTWINNPKFAGLYDERDPLAASIHEGEAHFTMPGVPVRSRVQGLPRFVTTKGGGYFFIPGRRAIAWLAALPRQPAP